MDTLLHVVNTYSQGLTSKFCQIPIKMSHFVKKVFKNWAGALDLDPSLLG